MKKILVPSVLCLLMGAAQAADNSPELGVYITGKIGASINRISSVEGHASGNGYNEYGNFGSKTKTTFAGGAAVGYDFYYTFQVPVRVELDFTGRSDAKVLNDKVKVNTMTSMVTGYYDFRNLDLAGFTPYLSAGLGYGRVKTKIESVGPLNESNSKNNVAWSVGLGTRYDIMPNLLVDAGYRYLDAGKGEVTKSGYGFSGKLEDKSRMHEIMLGITYVF